MHLRIAIVVFAMSACGYVTAQAHKSTATKAPARSTVGIDDHATWVEGTDTVVGLNRDQFAKAGLERLTPEEYRQLLLAMYLGRVDAAKTAVASQMTYVCGPVPVNYRYVKMYIEVSDNTPSQIASAIRQGLSSLREAQIVYSPLEADIGIEVIGAEYNTDAGKNLGYSVSVITFDPCKGSIANQEWPIRSVTDHFIQGGPDASELANRIVADLDNHDLENVRRVHAAVNKSSTSK